MLVAKKSSGQQEQKEKKVNDFDSITVSTKTFIVMTNITIDIQALFDHLPITKYTVIPKKRGRKKKTVVEDPNKNILDGSIITLDLANKIRGVILKKKRKKEGKKTPDFFRNSVTIVMVVDGKKINFKISRNGKFQMTGCKFDSHAEKCIQYIWDYIKDSKGVYTLNDSEKYFKATFIPAMRNIDFSLGFLIDREALDAYFNTETDYCSLLETSIGYTGVNIKIPVKMPISDLKLKQIRYKKGDWAKPKLVPYQFYLDTLKPKEQQKKLDKKRYNTFLVFHSGKVIMSSMCAEFARETYYEFLDIIGENRWVFEEKLD